MRVGWMVGCVLALAGGVAQAQNNVPQAQNKVPPAQSNTVTTVTIDRSGDSTVDRASRMSGHAGSALVSRGSAEAAILAEQALEKDRFNPWAHYRRAAALSDQRRTDEAVAAYKAAEDAFEGVDERGKSLALYGRAFTLGEAGRCAEAQPVYEQYARSVERRDAKGAAQARSMAQSCQPSTPEPTTGLTSEAARQKP